jgi:hypothetical protein
MVLVKLKSYGDWNAQEVVPQTPVHLLVLEHPLIRVPRYHSVYWLSLTIRIRDGYNLSEYMSQSVPNASERSEV